MDTAHLVGRERIRPLLRVDPGAKERFVRVDVAETADQRLIEEDGLDLAGATAQALLEPCRGKSSLQWFATQPLLEAVQFVVVQMKDPSEFALIREAEIGSIVELDGQVFESKRRLTMRDGAQPAGHAQMDDDRGAVIEVQDEVLRPPPDALDDAVLNARQNVLDTLAAEDAGEGADTQRVNALTDKFGDQGAADGFDLGEFWHTRVTIPGADGDG